MFWTQRLLSVRGGMNLSSALVPLAASGVGTLGVTEVLLMTGHHAAVAAAAARPLHLLHSGTTSVNHTVLGLRRKPVSMTT